MAGVWGCWAREFKAYGSADYCLPLVYDKYHSRCTTGLYFNMLRNFMPILKAAECDLLLPVA